MSLRASLHCYLHLHCYRNIGLYQQGCYRLRITAEYMNCDLPTPARVICSNQPRDGHRKEAEGYQSQVFSIDEELEEVEINERCGFEAIMTAGRGLKSSELVLIVTLEHCYARLGTEVKEDSGFTVKSKARVNIKDPLSGVHRFHQVVFPNEYYSTVDLLLHTSMTHCDIPSEIYEHIGERCEKILKTLFDGVVTPVVKDLETLQGLLSHVCQQIPDVSLPISLESLLSSTSLSAQYWDYFLEICPLTPAYAVYQSLQSLLNTIIYYNTEIMQVLLDLTVTRPSLLYEYYSDKEELYRGTMYAHIVKEKEYIVDSVPLLSPGNQGNSQKSIATDIRNSPLPLPMSPIYEDTETTFQSSTLPVLFSDLYTARQVLSGVETTYPRKGLHLIVLVNGYMGSWRDMVVIRNYIARKYNRRTAFFISRANEEGETKRDVMEMGRRLAVEVDRYVGEYYAGDLARLSFVGYSLGGVIVRAALYFLEQYKELMFSLITLSTPHLGLMYSSSVLVDTGVWFLRVFTHSPCLTQLSLKDSSNVRETALYQLSAHPGLQWFQHIALFSSTDDNFSPMESSRIELTEKATNGSEQGCYFIEMTERLIGNVDPKRLRRINVDFPLPISLSHMIGRKAHLEFLANHHFLTALSEKFPELFM